MIVTTFDCFGLCLAQKRAQEHTQSIVAVRYCTGKLVQIDRSGSQFFDWTHTYKISRNIRANCAHRDSSTVKMVQW